MRGSIPLIAGVAGMAFAVAVLLGPSALGAGEQPGAPPPASVPRDSSSSLSSRHPHAAVTPAPPAASRGEQAPQAPEPVHPALPDGAVPVRVRVPAVGVDAEVVQLGLDAQGRLDVPTDFTQAGWYSLGPRPGDVGPAVIAGHVDSRAGPAVFFRLRELTPGARIEVVHSDATTRVFRVYHLGQHPKERFPTSAVYANTDVPELRLITCGGTFDRKSRHYRDNVVVWARADPGA